MTISDQHQSGRAWLYGQIAAFFKARGLTTNVVFGIVERTKAINQGPGGANRIVLIPGALDGKDGTFAGAIGPGGNPRKLFTHDAMITFSLWAAAPDGNNRNELELEQAVDDMKEKLVQAVQATAPALVQWGDMGFNYEAPELRYGQEYLIEATLSTAVFDLADQLVAPITLKVNRGTVEIPPPGAPVHFEGTGG